MSPLDPRTISKEEWEALCTRCGKCCAEKVEIDGTVYLTARYCPHYDGATKLCRVYDNRFTVEPECRSIEAGIPGGIFPADCPYVKDIPGYRGPVESWSNPAVDATITEILGPDAIPPRPSFEV